MAKEEKTNPRNSIAATIETYIAARINSDKVALGLLKDLGVSVARLADILENTKELARIADNLTPKQ